MATRPEHPITLAASTAFFASNPTTAPLLENKTLSLPGSLTPKSSGEDSLFAVSLPHPALLTHCLVLSPPAPSPHAHGKAAPPGLDSVTVLFALGDGMNGHPAILHGGITCVLFDEAAGILLSMDAAARGADLGLFTTRLATEYRAPVATPGVVAVEVVVKGREGRAVTLDAVLKQDGKVCARAEVDYKRPRAKL